MRPHGTLATTKEPSLKRFRALVANAVTLSATSLVMAVAPGGVAHADVPVFINEIHYDNTGTDTGEGVEVAGPAGTDVGGWQLIPYNGNGGTTYTPVYTFPSPSIIPDEGAGFGALWAPILGLQNGAPDGVALVDDTPALVQFLSYEGTFAATNGIATGLTSTDIGVFQNGAEAIGLSLQLTGAGTIYEDFTWQAPADDSPGTLNAGQSFGEPVFTAVDPGDQTYFAGAEIAPLTLTATGGTAPYSFTAAPLPDGLSLTGDTISGTPTTPGVTTVVVGVTDSSDPAANAQTQFDITVLAPVCPSAIDPISEVQGTTETSPCVGQAVTVEGIVVGDYEGACLGTGVDQTCNLRGFYVQSRDADVDADPLTSEGVFVFHGSEDTLDVGDAVRVTGTVAEFQGQTQLGFPSEIVELSAGNPVTPAVVALPMANAAAFEQYEGMLVTFEQTLVVTETFHMSRSGEIRVSSGDRRVQPTAVVEPGAAAIDMQAANNLNYFIIDDAENTQNPDPYVYASGGGTLSAENTIRGGDTVTGATGVMTYTWAGFNATGNGNAYRLRPQSPAPEHIDDIAFVEANPRPAAPPEVGGSLKIVGFNVLNYFVSLDDGGNDCGVLAARQACRGANTAAEYERQHAKLIAALVDIDADVYGFAELENTEVTPGVDVDVLAPIVASLNAVHGDGVWDYVDTGLMGTDTIRVGLIYRTDKVEVLGHAIMDSTTWPAFDDDNNRPTLAVSLHEFATGGVLNVAVNHWKSKGSCPATGPDADQGDGAACWNAARVNAAESLLDWVADGPVGLTPDPDLLIFGDLNSYAKEDPIDVLLEDNGYVDLVQHFDPGAYSYVFDGQWGTLDYAIASPSLFAQVSDAADYHINADEPPILDYNTNFKTLNNQTVLYAPDKFRTSDHDPAVVGVALDSGKPTVTVEQAPGQRDPAPLRSDVSFAVTFSEPVTGFGPEDLIFTGGGVTPVISGSGADYTVTFRRVRLFGPITLSVAAGAAVDALGDASEASTSVDNTVTVVPPGRAR
jgi:predicted extracellular nuclease